MNSLSNIYYMQISVVNPEKELRLTLEIVQNVLPVLYLS